MSDSAKSIISIIIGDWSQDGHGKSDSFRFECSHPEKDVQRAYLAFVKKYKLGLHDTENGGHTPMLCEYQENIVTKDQHDILVKAGVDFDAEFMDAETNDDGGLWFSPQSVAVLPAGNGLYKIQTVI